MDESLAQRIDSHRLKADEKLSTAAKLVEWGAFEDAVSRAYYAAFHAAKAMLASQGFEPDTHGGVKTLFHLHFIKSRQIDPKFGRYLTNLKDDREEGDYDVVSTVDQQIARNALREATEFVAEARRFLKPFLPSATSSN